MTTYSATSDDKVVKFTIFGFQCMTHLRKQCYDAWCRPTSYMFAISSESGALFRCQILENTCTIVTQPTWDSHLLGEPTNRYAMHSKSHTFLGICIKSTAQIENSALSQEPGRCIHMYTMNISFLYHEYFTSSVYMSLLDVFPLKLLIPKAPHIWWYMMCSMENAYLPSTNINYCIQYCH